MFIKNTFLNGMTIQEAIPVLQLSIGSPVGETCVRGLGASPLHNALPTKDIETDSLAEPGEDCLCRQS